MLRYNQYNYGSLLTYRISPVTLSVIHLFKCAHLTLSIMHIHKYLIQERPRKRKVPKIVLSKLMTFNSIEFKGGGGV